MKAFSGTAWKQGGYWGFWFRVFGYGLVVSNMTPVFSERYGYSKVVRFLGIKVKLLVPERKQEEKPDLYGLTREDLFFEAGFAFVVILCIALVAYMAWVWAL